MARSFMDSNYYIDPNMGSSYGMSPNDIRDAAQYIERKLQTRVRNIETNHMTGGYDFYLDFGEVLTISGLHELSETVERFHMKYMRGYRVGVDPAYCPGAMIVSSATGYQYINMGGGCVYKEEKPKFTCKSCKEEGLEKNHVLDYRRECEATRKVFAIKVKKLFQYRKAKEHADAN